MQISNNSLIPIVSIKGPAITKPIGPNKNEEYQEDIVVELKDGRQFSFFLNRFKEKVPI